MSPERVGSHVFATAISEIGDRSKNRLLEIHLQTRAGIQVRKRSDNDGKSILADFGLEIFEYAKGEAAHRGRRPDFLHIAVHFLRIATNRRVTAAVGAGLVLKL